MVTLAFGVAQIAYSFLPFTFEFRIPDKATSLLTILNAANETILEILVNEDGVLMLEAESRHIRQISVPSLFFNYYNMQNKQY